MKTSESLRFSDVFRGYRSGTLVENGLRNKLKRFLGIGSEHEKNIAFKTADLVTFTEEILNGKLHFLCSEMSSGLNFTFQ